MNDPEAGKLGGGDPATYRERYVALCSLGLLVREVEERRERFVEDAMALLERPYVAAVRKVDPAHDVLCVRTRCAYLRKYPNEPWREIGEFIVRITRKQFLCTNVTRQIAGYHHPHVHLDGVMCTTMRDQIMRRVADGYRLEALDAVWERLNSTSGNPYSSADHTQWPVAKEQ